MRFPSLSAKTKPRIVWYAVKSNPLILRHNLSKNVNKNAQWMGLTKNNLKWVDVPLKSTNKYFFK